MTNLFDPITLWKTTFQNCVWVLPMCPCKANDGLITTPEQAQHIVESNEADAIFLAREMICNPRWALSAAEKLGVKINWPAPLERGQTLPAK